MRGNRAAGFCILLFSILACNLYAGLGTSPPSRSAVATIVAQTMQAVASASSTPAAALARPALASPSPSATPMAIIKAVTYCRSGPAESYKSIVDVSPDQQAALLGKDSAGTYWLVQTSSGECWIAAGYLSIVGDASRVPEVTPPPSTSGIPAKPGSLYYQYFCSATGVLNTNLTWADASTNETGFHVYRNGTLTASLPANSTGYVDTTTIKPGSTITYSVTAFNDAGESPARSQSFQCK